MYYRNTAAAIIVYDITDYKSFTGAKSWISELRSKDTSNAIISLTGNKTDLEDARAVSYKVLILV